MENKLFKELAKVVMDNYPFDPDREKINISAGSNGERSITITISERNNDEVRRSN